jgi:galactokinase
MNKVFAHRSVAPGRVNLIGDHTDYTGGLVLPMAIKMFTSIEFSLQENYVDLRSESEEGIYRRALSERSDPQTGSSWGRYVDAVLALIDEPQGLTGVIRSTLPIGAGLSSSASLEVALALALGFQGDELSLALLGQRAEHMATQVPCGIMDQLCIASAVAGSASLINCSTYEVAHIPIPDDVKVVVRFIMARKLEGSEYAQRVDECQLAERFVGPLNMAGIDEVANIPDAIIRSRAIHVVSENARVSAFATALSAGDFSQAGELMLESHKSLAENFAVSVPEMDQAVADLVATPGVYGARMTGGGFGGCVVALCEPNANVDGWVVEPVGAANLQ